MSLSTLLFQALTILALITSSLSAVVPPSQSISQAFPPPSNLSLPQHLAIDDVRFGLRGHFGDETLNIISLLMNTVSGLANLAHQPYQKPITGFHVDILPWYANIDISIQPVRPAGGLTIEIAVNALYHVVYNMITNKVFKNADFDILWDGNIVGRIQINKAPAPPRTVNGVPNTSQTADKQIPSSLNDATAANSTAKSSVQNEGLRLYFHYFPGGGKLTFQEVFITLMAALKGLSQWPSAQVVEPFRTGARSYNARMQFFGTETPRTEPPFLTYAILIDTVRQTALQVVQDKKFVEMQVVVAFDDEVVGEALLEKGSPE